MTVWARFILPFSSPLFRPSSFPCPFFASSVLLPQLSTSSCVFLFLIRLSLSPLLNPARSGERCKLPQRVRVVPALLTLLVHFQAEICPTFVTDLMINSYFTAHFTLLKMTTKVLWWRLGGIAPATFWPWGRSPLNVIVLLTVTPTVSRRRH